MRAAGDSNSDKLIKLAEEIGKDELIAIVLDYDFSLYDYSLKWAINQILIDTSIRGICYLSLLFYCWAGGSIIIKWSCIAFSTLLDIIPIYLCVVTGDECCSSFCTSMMSLSFFWYMSVA